MNVKFVSSFRSHAFCLIHLIVDGRVDPSMVYLTVELCDVRSQKFYQKQILACGNIAININVSGGTDINT